MEEGRRKTQNGKKKACGNDFGESESRKLWSFFYLLFYFFNRGKKRKKKMKEQVFIRCIFLTILMVSLVGKENVNLSNLKTNKFTKTILFG